MAEYSELLQKLFSYPGRGGQTFDAMQRLDAHLGKPHNSFRSIHVAGTNGKGSVATKISAALQAQGHKTALYTSPHISSFRERIRIDGQMISEAAVQSILPEIFRAVALLGLEVAFFDLITALAFVYFSREKVDFAVVEVGLGGRLDATNVIHPILTVITSVDFDHMSILGNSLEEIAKEKGGIQKSGVPLIVGPEARSFFPSAITATRPKLSFYDFENQEIARTALIELQSHMEIGSAAIESGLQLRPPCRFEIIGNVILDVAHNPHGFQRLGQALKFHFPGKKFPFYLAFSQEKDWRGCLDCIRPYASEVRFLRTLHPRLVAPNILMDYFPEGKSAEISEITEGVVCGSFYIMGDVRKALGLDAANSDICNKCTFVI
ncbi:MAG: Mur ligase family protein [Chlamydiota bacterium]